MATVPHAKEPSEAERISRILPASENQLNSSHRMRSPSREGAKLGSDHLIPLSIRQPFDFRLKRFVEKSLRRGMNQTDVPNVDPLIRKLVPYPIRQDAPPEFEHLQVIGCAINRGSRLFCRFLQIVSSSIKNIQTHPAHHMG